MPLTVENVTATGGFSAYFGKDIVDNWPIGPLKLKNQQTFFYDPHSDNFQRLFFLANSSLFTTGTGASGTPAPGLMTAWMRQNSGIPGQETE